MRFLNIQSCNPAQSLTPRSVSLPRVRLSAVLANFGFSKNIPNLGIQWQSKLNHVILAAGRNQFLALLIAQSITTADNAMPRNNLPPPPPPRQWGGSILWLVAAPLGCRLLHSGQQPLLPCSWFPWHPLILFIPTPSHGTGNQSATGANDSAQCQPARSPNLRRLTLRRVTYFVNISAKTNVLIF